MRKANIGNITVDETFDVLSYKLDKSEECFTTLDTYVTIACDTSLLILKGCSSIATSAEQVFDPDIGYSSEESVIQPALMSQEEPISPFIRKRDAKLLYEEEIKIYEKIIDYDCFIKSTEIPIRAELEILENKIIPAVKQVLSLVVNLKREVKARNAILLDYDKFLLKVKQEQERDVTKKGLVHNNESRYKSERKLYRTRDLYENINSMLKKKITCFLVLTAEVLEPILITIIYSHLNVSCEFTRTLEQLQERFDISLAVLLSDENYTQLTESFNRNYSLAMDSINQLAIIGGSRNSPTSVTLKLSSAHRKPLTRESDEEHCTALYPFHGIEPGDLSFEVNDRIKVVRREGSGWWYGELHQVYGIFPSNYVRQD